MLESSLTADSSVAGFVANNPLFYSLAPPVIDSIAEKFQVRTYAPDALITEEGLIGDSFYLIRSGRVRVFKIKDGEELVLSELGSGEGFGEMALLIDQPRSASVKAIDEVEALILMRDDFTTLTRRIPELAEKFNRLLAERVSLLEVADDSEESRVKFKASQALVLDYSYLDMLMKLNEAAGGHEQVEHCKETGQLAREMSKMLCPMVSEKILFAGYLHEIGKVSISRELIDRERRGEELNDEEKARFAEVFRFTVEILAPNRNLHDAVSFIEYLDKTDYREMPLEAQILKVADDYMMMNNPAYRDMKPEAALQAIRQGAGTQYNPRVVAALEKNVRKFTEVLVDSQLTVLRMMVIALDRKDRYTWDHSMDVRDMGLKIVNRLGLGRKEQEYMRIGSELHDVGKIYIDESILNAPRKLTDEEFEIMKTHAARSADFLVDIPGMDELAAIVRAHHEKYDGTGYPDKLKGTDIPYLARIMTIADVWSALTTPRVYRLNPDGTRKGFTKAKALSIMEEMAGNLHFDPELFPVFQDIVREMIAKEEEAAAAANPAEPLPQGSRERSAPS